DTPGSWFCPRMSWSAVRQPISSQKEPERQAGVGPVALEASLDRPIANWALAAEQPCVGRPGPRIEDQPVVPREHQHDVRGSVWPHAGQRLKLCRHLVVRQIVV